MRSKLIALAGATLFLAGACGGDEPSGYSSEVREDFVSNCAAGGGQEAEDLCGCTYDAIEETLPFDEFREADERLADDPTADVPAEVTDAMTECATAGLDLPTTTP